MTVFGLILFTLSSSMIMAPNGLCTMLSSLTNRKYVSSLSSVFADKLNRIYFAVRYFFRFRFAENPVAV